MNRISFMGANFVARVSGYPGGTVSDWGRHDQATQDYFRPLAMFRERIASLLDSIADLGFSSLDLWVAHLHPEWATPEHIAIFREEIASRKIRVASLAGSFGASPVEFRASCRLAASLDIPILGGMAALLHSDRQTMVNLLREFGLVFALENHPEKSPEELLAKLGHGDTDVLALAIDTGWFGTQGFPADVAIRSLSHRIAHVHLKDVEAAGGHETCALGKGVVPVEACMQVLQEIGYAGGISLEHEPFGKDPSEDCRLGKLWLESQLRPSANVISPSFEPVRVAIVGCGNVSQAYGQQLSSYPEIALRGAFDMDSARAESFARQFSCRSYSSLEEVLADPEVEVVINLTIHHAHYEVIRRSLLAGKHVHSEKPLATTSAQAHELVALADSLNLRLSGAPTTWLGEAQQTAWACFDSGFIGEARVAYAEVNWGRIESWHPNPAPFYEVGPVFDVAVYPITLLTAWFGPVRSVIAGGGILYPNRKTREGTPFQVASEDWTSAILQLEGQLTVRLTSSFYVAAISSQSGLEIHGDLGTIRMNRWDISSSWVEAGRYGQTPRRLPLVRPGFNGIEFARGARDLAQAIRENRPHRCTGAQAAHVVEVCESILASVREGRKIELKSSFPPPAPTEWAVAARSRFQI